MCAVCDYVRDIKSNIQRTKLSSCCFCQFETFLFMAMNSSWLSDADFVKNVKQRENVEKEKKMWQKNANTHNFAIVLEESMSIRGHLSRLFSKKIWRGKENCHSNHFNSRQLYQKYALNYCLLDETSLTLFFMRLLLHEMVPLKIGVISVVDEV